MGSRNRSNGKNSTSSKTTTGLSKPPPEEQVVCYEGESLARLLKSIGREMETTRLVNTNLPDKIWLKQLFSVGVNDVTRVLERMPSVATKEIRAQQSMTSEYPQRKVAPVSLQAILVASDCNPRWLIRHLTSMACSRNVPLLFVKDKKGGSARLGELVGLKTALAVGVKVKHNAVNELIKEILPGQGEVNSDALIRSC